MKTSQTTIALLGCLAVLLLAGVSELVMKNTAERYGLLAAVKASTQNPMNMFLRSKESYLNLTSPYFDFITAFSAAPIATLTDFPSPATLLNQSDILSITNPQPIAQVSNVEHSLVNIFCSQKIGNARKVITGSGVLIKDGLVLTNAHVGVYPLVADSNAAITCLARTGSPAVATHSVKVIFISPEWVQTTGPLIAGSYLVTGENDYALLKITPLSTAKKTLVPLRTEENVPDLGSRIKVAAYPANILGAKGIDTALVSKSESLTVRDLINFDGSRATPGSADLLETSATQIGQQGSSGGLLADQNNNIVGLISNVVGSGDTVGTFIRGVTIRGINRSLQRYSSGGMSGLLLLGTENLASSFNQTYRTSLTSIVSRALSL